MGKRSLRSKLYITMEKYSLVRELEDLESFLIALIIINFLQTDK